MKTILVIPTYNEVGNLQRLIESIRQQSRALDILIVDDNSPDGTGQLADRYASENSYVHVLHRPAKKGLGQAYQAGFRWALDKGYDAMMQMDADLSHDPAAIPRFLEKINDYDAVFGSRYLKGVRVYNWSFKRLLLSKVSNEFIRAMLDLDSTDTTTAYKCFRREVLEAVQFEKFHGHMNAFLIELVWATIKKGFKTVEIPFVFIERESGESKMEWRVALESLWTTIRLIFSKPQ